MDTRELFDRLVSDEPPLLLSVSQAVDAGRRAQRNRYVGAVAAAAAVVVAVSGGVIETQRASTPETPGGVEPSTSQAPSLPPVPTFTFDSAAQITASNARVYGLLTSYAGGASEVTKGDPTWDTGPITDKTESVATQVQYRVAGGIGMLRAVTGTARDANTRYAGFLGGDLCAELSGRPNDDGSTVDCAHNRLPGGGSLWTYSRKEGSPGEITNRSSTSTLGPALYERDAIVVAADGSALDLTFQELGTRGGGPVPLPLTDAVQPSLESLGGLAVDAAGTWLPHDGSVVAVPTSGPSVSASPPSAQLSMQAMPSLGGPGITKLPFRNAAQITASSAAAYAKLVAAAGGAGSLIKGWPLWDTEPVSSASRWVGTQVQWAVGGDSGYLQAVTLTPAESAKEYGTSLKSPCGTGLGQPLGSVVRCESVPLPGGANAWTWDVEGRVADAHGATSASSPKRILARGVMVIARDRSTLTVRETAQQGHAVGGGTPAAVPNSMPVPEALFRLATEMAQEWQAAAG